MKAVGALHTARLSGLDFLLSATASALAVFSVGAALFDVAIGLFFVAGVVVATSVGYLIQRFLTDEQTALYGAIAYAVAALTGFFLGRSLNEILPGDGIPIELSLAGRLSYLLIFGSTFAWRDSTLLFQAVPCIALFGMVGSWDTFGQAPIAFFAFLLCIATLFGRVHLRAMTAQALHALGGNPAVLQRDMPEIRRNAWRWMAGPEWALGSAAAIILVSLIGAPLLRDSVKDISDAIRVRVPRPRTPPASRPLTGSGQQQSTRIGLGAIDFSNEVVLLAELDQPRYLRANVYTNYTGRGWAAAFSSTSNIDPEALDKHLLAIEDPVEVPFDIEIVSGNHEKLPFPGELLAHDQRQRLFRQADGTASFSLAVGKARVSGIGAVPSSIADARDSRPVSSVGIVHSEVTQLAREVTASAKTDWDRAMAIKREIERRCKYNLNASAVVTGDAVQEFLFENREGYCDLFASAMTIMAKSQGLDARYVVGYYPIHNERLPDGRYVIRDSEAHAWCEIFFEGVGWVPFDATEGADQVEGAGLGSDGRREPWYKRTWVLALALMGGAGLLYYIVPKLRFSVSRRAAPNLRRTELARLYWSFARIVEKSTGKPKHLSQTPFEYLTEVGPRLSAGQAEADAINRRFVSLLYGPEAPESGELEEIRRQLRMLKDVVKRA